MKRFCIVVMGMSVTIQSAACRQSVSGAGAENTTASSTESSSAPTNKAGAAEDARAEELDRLENLMVLAIAARVDEKLDAAEALLLDVRGRFGGLQGPDSVNAAHCSYELSLVYLLQGRAKLAEVAASAALATYKGQLGPQDRCVARALTMLGVALHESDPETAKTHYRDAIRIFEEMGGEDESEFQLAGTNLADLEGADGQKRSEAEGLSPAGQGEAEQKGQSKQANKVSANETPQDTLVPPEVRYKLSPEAEELKNFLDRGAYQVAAKLLGRNELDPGYLAQRIRYRLLTAPDPLGDATPGDSYTPSISVAKEIFEDYAIASELDPACTEYLGDVILRTVYSHAQAAARDGRGLLGLCDPAFEVWYLSKLADPASEASRLDIIDPSVIPWQTFKNWSNAYEHLEEDFIRIGKPMTAMELERIVAFGRLPLADADLPASHTCKLAKILRRSLQHMTAGNKTHVEVAVNALAMLAMHADVYSTTTGDLIGAGDCSDLLQIDGDFASFLGLTEPQQPIASIPALVTELRQFLATFPLGRVPWWIRHRYPKYEPTFEKMLERESRR